MSGIDSARDEKWSEWFTWHGAEKCPIDSDCTVEFVTKGMGGGETNNPKALMWVQAGTEADIIAYRHKIKEPESDMHPDLEWLAREVGEWSENEGRTHVWLFCRGNSRSAMFCDSTPAPFRTFAKSEWQAARQQLGLDQPEVTPDEEEAWQAKERQLIGKRNKYMREIKPGVWVDVYDVLHAWRVQNPALQHLIKKALQPGGRGHKTMEQDMCDIVASALRARELGE